MNFFKILGGIVSLIPFPGAGLVGGLISGSGGLFGKGKKQAEFDRLSNISVMLRTTNETNKLNALIDKGFSKTIDKPNSTEKTNVGDAAGKTGLFSKIGKFFTAKGGGVSLGKVGLVAGGAALLFGLGKLIFGKKKNKAAKMDKQQTLYNDGFNRNNGPYNRDDYFKSNFNNNVFGSSTYSPFNQTGPTNQFAGFSGPAYRPQQPMYAPRPLYGRPAVNPRMAQFNPNPNFNPNLNFNPNPNFNPNLNRTFKPFG